MSTSDLNNNSFALDHKNVDMDVKINYPLPPEILIEFKLRFSQIAKTF